MNTSQLIISSLIGITGVILGSIITHFFNLKVKSKEVKLRIIEKVFDKRMIAHENVLDIVKLLRSVIPTGLVDNYNNIIGFPVCLKSRSILINYRDEIFQTIHINSHWFDTILTKELSFVQDYFMTLENVISEVSDDNISKIGLIVKQDFINISTKLEDITFNFFRSDIYKISINKLNEWHKYPVDITRARLEETELFRRRDEIDKIIQNH